MIKSIYFLLFTIFCFSQKDNNYIIDKEIKINAISFEKSTGPIYRTDRLHILTKVTLTFRNDSCYVTTKHTDDVEKVLSDEEYLRPDSFNNHDFVISKSVFFDIVNQLENVNFDAIQKHNFTVFDGSTYRINFGNYNFDIDYSYHVLEAYKDNKNAEVLLKLFNDIWVLVEKNSK